MVNILAGSGSIADVLDSAMKQNNSEEIQRIVQAINSTVFDNYVSMAQAIRKHVEELDPFEPESVIGYILDNVSPEHKKIMDPVQIVLFSTPRQSTTCWSRCFPGRET